MAARRKAGGSGKRKAGGERPIEQYEHKGKQRANNPAVGLVTPESDRDTGGEPAPVQPWLFETPSENSQRGDVLTGMERNRP